MSPTRTILAALVIVACASCDALEPNWSTVRQVGDLNPGPGASCDTVCEQHGNLCLENSCGKGTIAVYDDPESPTLEAIVPTACEEPLANVVGDGPGWSATISCCCGSD